MPANSECTDPLEEEPTLAPIPIPPEEVTSTPAVPEPINWEERCKHLEHQLSSATEATRLRKRLLEIRETETDNLKSKLKLLSDSITEEKRVRLELMKRVEAAELECMTVKDKLKRNLEALERVKGHHERRVTMLTANLEIADIKGQGNARKLEEAHRKNAELKGLLEELNMKLNENRKVTKGLEKTLKKANDKNQFLTSQISLINEILVEEGGDGDGDVQKIKKILNKAEDREAPSASGETNTGDNKGEDEDEGVELSSLLELEGDDVDAQKEIPGEESCYKRVDTSDGPQFILSVSRTFIKLKDLILEKRSLQTAIDNLKGLNTKLESKVDKQERRLYCVTKEVNKTWSLVSKLKLQQDRLHNNEAFLRYELKENRAVVERLKKEMQSYKEKWRTVREKNDESQTVWQQLKDEFAQRRQQSQNSNSSASTSTSMSTPTPPMSPKAEEAEINAELDHSDLKESIANPENEPRPNNDDVTVTDDTLTK